MINLTLSRTLATRSDSELIDLHDRWIGGDPPARRPELVMALRRMMRDPGRVGARVGALTGAQAALFRLLLADAGRAVGFERLRRDAESHGIAGAPLRALLADLVSVGLLAEIPAARRTAPAGAPDPGPTWGVPEEIAEAVGEESLSGRGPGAFLTLNGWLEHRLRQRSGNEIAGEQARRMYLMLAGEGALRARMDGLAAPLRAFLHESVTRHGGVVSVELLPKFGIELSPLEVGAALESASLGTLCELDFEPYGLRQRKEAIVLFHETVLAHLRRLAEESPPQPTYVASIGTDFVSNFSRFASFVEGDTVRFTVRGTIFKSTGKRMAESLLPNPGREFRRLEILELEYRFALECGMIDRTGERSFRLTPRGQFFLRKPLLDKQRLMLDWLAEDRRLPGDLAHQMPLRRTVLRWLKRLEPGRWYDAMFLPFVARNHYLATLPDLGAHARDSSSFPVRASADLQSLAWNLFLWIRKYLYLLGVVDMGYDASGRAIALRLTPLGAELLEMLPGRALRSAGHLVVNPDFEVVLFPDEFSHELIYQLDRFCDREQKDTLYRYRIAPGALHRALGQGMTLDEVLRILRENARTPLPQNVAYSMESWARKSGLVTVHADGRLHCELAEILDRFAGHPEVQRAGAERPAPDVLLLRQPMRRDDLAEIALDLGIGMRFHDAA
ncbi:MAG: helicase-associated domain-containing protein [Planctomycetota bacterium]|nr:helicase-associated domain-containing protein [Planctomycetota bacterium]